MMSACIPPGSPARKKLDQLQARRAALIAQRDAIKQAPPTVDDLRENARAEVARVQHRVPRPSFDVRANETAAMVGQRLASILIALIGVGRVVDALVEQRVAELGGAPHGLPRAEREKAIGRLDAELTSLEREEEVEVLRLEALGHFIVRRGDINGRAIVQLWHELRADAGQVTT